MVQEIPQALYKLGNAKGRGGKETIPVLLGTDSMLSWRRSSLISSFSLEGVEMSCCFVQFTQTTLLCVKLGGVDCFLRSWDMRSLRLVKTYSNFKAKSLTAALEVPTA